MNSRNPTASQALFLDTRDSSGCPREWTKERFADALTWCGYSDALVSLAMTLPRKSLIQYGLVCRDDGDQFYLNLPFFDTLDAPTVEAILGATNVLPEWWTVDYGWVDRAFDEHWVTRDGVVKGDWIYFPDGKKKSIKGKLFRRVGTIE